MLTSNIFSHAYLHVRRYFFNLFIFYILFAVILRYRIELMEIIKSIVNYKYYEIY